MAAKPAAAEPSAYVAQPPATGSTEPRQQAALRCFVGAWPDSATAARLVALGRALHGEFPHARAVPRHKLHLTLVFIGELHAASAGRVAAGLRALAVAPCAWTIDRIDHFEGARVAWAGGPTPAALAELVCAIESILNKEGVDFDRRPYRPHVTLLRRLPRDSARLARPIAPAIDWIVRRPVLIRSAQGSYLEVAPAEAG